ncbi:MAG TPA: glycosyltransferase family 2 protein, partial [Candidatus Hydrogenedentes bacterium]|nr:glycosyltransferase family 2 protein [Candidatus Hydrogenedentota bacterium]
FRAHDGRRDFSITVRKPLFMENASSTETRESSAVPEYSVIVPCFQEAATLKEFHGKLAQFIRGFHASFEIIYVSDGSTDGTIEVLREIFDADETVTSVVDLARNYGQTNALTAGIERANGRHLVFMDCDLQVNPADLGILIEEFQKGNYDMVGGRRVERRDNRGRVWISRLGNAVIGRLLGVPLHDLGCGMKVLDGGLMRSFRTGPQRPLDPGAAMLCIRSVAEVPITHQPRRHDRSRWTLRRVLLLYRNLFTSLIPGLFPFAVGALFFVLVISFMYVLGAWAAPTFFPLPGMDVLLPVLILSHMILSLVFFIVLAEFMLHGSAAENELAYIARRVWTRPWKPCRGTAASRESAGKSDGFTG